MILVTEKIADDFTEIVNDAKKDQEGPLVPVSYTHLAWVDTILTRVLGGGQ